MAQNTLLLHVESQGQPLTLQTDARTWRGVLLLARAHLEGCMSASGLSRLNGVHSKSSGTGPHCALSQWALAQSLTQTEGRDRLGHLRAPARACPDHTSCLETSSRLPWCPPAEDRGCPSAHPTSTNRRENQEQPCGQQCPSPTPAKGYRGPSGLMCN